MTHPKTQIDVRDLHPSQRHPIIFSSFGQLAEGQTLELVNDHDPKSLYLQLCAQAPGEFAWDYLEQGPLAWRVVITRTAEAPAITSDPTDSCCGGGCGGRS